MGTFTDDQLHRIQHPIIQNILPRIGYNANMPRAIVYGPTESGGIGFISLFILQGLQKVKHILQAYRHNTQL